MVKKRLIFLERILGTLLLAAFALAPAAAQTRQQQKQQFLKSVDESISVSMIVGNPYRYVGKHVDLHCTASPIHASGWFGCNDEDGNEVVIEASTHDISPGQSLRILGIVDQPMEMENENGGSGNAGTVKALFMQ